MTELIIGNEFGPKVTPLIKQAKYIICIAVFTWYWYPNQTGSEIQKFNNAIVAAAKKGVNVKVMANEQQTISILNRYNIKARKLETIRKVHVKLMLIDNHTAIFGSHNYTMGAFTTNYEVSIMTQNKGVVNRSRQFFNNLWPAL